MLRIQHATAENKNPTGDRTGWGVPTGGAKDRTGAPGFMNPTVSDCRADRNRLDHNNLCDSTGTGDDDLENCHDSRPIEEQANA